MITIAHVTSLTVFTSGLWGWVANHPKPFFKMLWSNETAWC